MNISKIRKPASVCGYYIVMNECTETHIHTYIQLDNTYEIRWYQQTSFISRAPQRAHVSHIRCRTRVGGTTEENGRVKTSVFWNMFPISLAGMLRIHGRKSHRESSILNGFNIVLTCINPAMITAIFLRMGNWMCALNRFNLRGWSRLLLWGVLASPLIPNKYLKFFKNA